MDAGLQQTLQTLQALDFTGKGEAFVEQRFVTPLLTCLGYETHRDYEVMRHGDEGAGFKLHYPPTERGAKPVKHYNPDYVPKIRKKMFWVIEAKTARDLSYPFEDAFLVQGFQYCIHPEIQAEYLLLTNGLHSAVYDVRSSVFFERDMYDPILEFKSSELIKKWELIYQTLSVETLRTRIERNLKDTYDKLSLSSLDKEYPHRLLRYVGQSAANHMSAIEQHVRDLYLEEMARRKDAWRVSLEQNDADYAYAMMDMPLRIGGRTEASYYVAKRLGDGAPEQAVFDQLTHEFVRQGIFRKVQTFVGLCDLYQRSKDDAFKMTCRMFLDAHKDADLPLINQVECAALRLTRKNLVISHYPDIRERIKHELASAPEILRFVAPPNALEEAYAFELERNRSLRQMILHLADPQLAFMLDKLQEFEHTIDSEYRRAYTALSDHEREIGGFATYGVGGKHYAFKNILINRGMDPR